jgi:pimeloyl-ACP methyl ester carboxylesterase
MRPYRTLRRVSLAGSKRPVTLTDPISPFLIAGGGEAMMIRRAMRALSLTVVLLIVGLILGTTPAGAAPARDDSANEPVYLIHGFSLEGYQSCTGWNSAISGMRSYGWTGPLHTVAYYAGDTNCDVRIGSGSRDTSVQELGRQLAWDIYNRYSVNGVSVDLVGHSMGGLVARAALTGVARGLTDWPPHLYVEDVATLGTPHAGTSWAYLCFYRQCGDMRPGSAFLSWAYPSPQSAQGTDWTLAGSEDDEVVSADSAIGMDAGHKVRYASGTGLQHSDLRTVTSGSFQQSYWNYHDPTWRSTASGAAPVRVANNGLYFWSQW